MNHLIITFADNKQFAIPVRILATIIAKYFARTHRSRGENYEKAYDAEFNYYRSHPELLIAWASDMPWKKIRRLLAFRGISEPIIKDYQQEWGDARKEIKDL